MLHKEDLTFDRVLEGNKFMLSTLSYVVRKRVYIVECAKLEGETYLEVNEAICYAVTLWIKALTGITRWQ